MRLLVVVIIVFVTSLTQSSAQDVLMFLNGNEEEVKITEVSSSEVKYKRMNNLEGPTFSTLKSELFMIKYANGDKDVIEHTAATQEVTPTPTPQPVQQEAVQTQSALSQPTQTSSGLSSAVQVDEEQSQGYAKPQTDKYGRTRDENLRLRRKRVVGGAVSMGLGGVTLVTGTVLLVQGLRFKTFDDAYTTHIDHPAHNYDIAGGLLMAAGFGVIVTGAGLLGAARKYKRRAAELADGGFQLDPVILNDSEYAGANIQNNSGFGFKLSYQF